MPGPDWEVLAGLEPGESRFVSCVNKWCITGITGLCRDCEQPWAHCGCGQIGFDCECGLCTEIPDEYPHRRVMALELAIIRHRKTTGKDAAQHDLELYKVIDQI